MAAMTPLPDRNPDSVDEKHYHEWTQERKAKVSHEQQQDANNNAVEIATLSLPSHTAQIGLKSGDGNEVILEALPETVGKLLLHGDHRNNSIAAIIDLKRLEELAPEGVSKIGEFIADLHTACEVNNQSADADVSTSECFDVIDEERPLLMDKDKYYQNKGHSSSSSADHRGIALHADPFLESLADALQQSNGEFGEDSKGNGGTYTIAEATVAKENDPQNLNLQFGNDAFLLNIPNYQSSGVRSGETENHFVLALPSFQQAPEKEDEESIGDESVLSRAATASADASAAEETTMLDTAISLMEDYQSAITLPSDIVNIHLEAHHERPPVENGKQQSTDGENNNVHLDLVVNRQVPIIGYVILVCALVSLASIGAALDLQQGPSATHKTLWRQMATCCVLGPLVLLEMPSCSPSKIKWLSRRQWIYLIGAAAAYAYFNLSFTMALEMTTMPNAFVLGNMTSLVIVAGRFALRLPILPAEGIGTLVGFAGAVICARSASAELDEGNSTLWGNLVALSSSFGCVVYLLVAKDMRQEMDLFVFMFCIMFFGSIQLVCFIILSGMEFSWGMDPDDGLIGWLDLSPDRLPLEMFIAIVCNCFGTTGYIACLKYFEAIVPATVMLMEPVVGSLLGVATGTARFPSLAAWIGNAVVAAGTLCVVWSGSKKTEMIDATEAVRPSREDEEMSVITLTSSALKRNIGRSKDTNTQVVWEST